MALTIRQRNNVIILISAIMIIALTIMNRFTNRVPDDAHPLFDKSTPLQQLQLGKLWMAKQDDKWLCADNVLNCQDWVSAWENIKISPLTSEPETHELAIELVIKIKHRETSQIWSFIPEDGLLKSSNGNWYQVPVSLKSGLIPITNAK